MLQIVLQKEREEKATATPYPTGMKPGHTFHTVVQSTLPRFCQARTHSFYMKTKVINDYIR